MEPDYKKKDRTAQPKPKTCKELYPNGSDERLACCAAGNKTTWSGDETTGICKCNDNTKEWKNGTCVAKSAPKTCTPACSANQKCENGECINKENTDDEQAKLNKEAKERMDAFVKACGNARFSPKQIENDSVICDIGGDENKPAKKDIVDRSLLAAAGKLSDVECKQQISYDSSRNFSFVFCSTGLRSGNMNTIRYYHKGYIKDRQTINFFADIEVTLAQAKNLIQYYAQKNNLGTLNCSDDYKNFYNQDWITCSNSTNEYTFEFDDVKEGSQDTRIGSVSKAVCKILNGSWSAGASYDSDICYLDKNICLGEYTTKVKSILGSDYPTGMELSWLETGRQCKFYNKLQ